MTCRSSLDIRQCRRHVEPGVGGERSGVRHDCVPAEERGHELVALAVDALGARRR